MVQLKWLFRCLQGKYLRFCLAMLMAVLSALLYIFYPFIIKTITDQVLIGETLVDGTVYHNLGILPPLLLALVICQLLRSADRYGMICLLEKLSQDLVEHIKIEIYTLLNKQDATFYAEYRTGDLMTRLTGDIDMVRHTVAWLSYNLVENGFVFLFANIFFFTINTKLTLILILIAPFLAVATFVYSKSIYPLYQQLRKKLSNMNSQAQENISGNKLVRAFVREEYEEQKFEKCNEEFRDANLKASFQWLKFFPYVEGMSQSFNIIIILVGGLLIIKGEMTPGDLMAFSLLSWGISNPMKQLGMYLNDLQRFFASADKVMELYTIPSRIVSPVNGHNSKGKLNGNIEFKNVNYRYPGSKTFSLKNINLKIEKGETVAIMGPTGSGKTTLINLIVRLIDVTSGSVTVDGIDVRKWQLQDLRTQIGVATQDVLLYSNTVDANIAYGVPDLAEEEVQYFAEMSAAHFINDLSNGYDTIIGERGTGLSGGQKQRIALARALAIKPSILILDDTTSAVDMETEQTIRNNMDDLPFECTKIIIAQRISTVKKADKIVVLQEGQIIDIGTHDELIASCEYYKSICRLQGQEEVASIVC